MKWRQQSSLMLMDPAYGLMDPYPSHAQQYRDHHGNIAWLFNPWTCTARDPRDIGSDPFGHLIIPPKEPVVVAEKEESNMKWFVSEGRKYAVTACFINMDDSKKNRDDCNAYLDTKNMSKATAEGVIWSSTDDHIIVVCKNSDVGIQL